MAAVAKRAQAALLGRANRLSRDANSGNVMQHALRLVKSVLAKELTPNGLTTAEIYKLTKEHPLPPDLKPQYFPPGFLSPPNPHTIIRSQGYLKRWILPVLQANRFIRMVPIQRGTLPSELVWAWVKPNEDQNVVQPELTIESDRTKRKKEMKAWKGTKPKKPKGPKARMDKAVNRYRQLQEAVRINRRSNPEEV